MMHPALRISGNAEVVPDILVPNLVNPEFGAVVEDAHTVAGRHGVVVPKPEYLRLRSAFCFTVEDDRVTDVDVRDVVWGRGKPRRSCNAKNKNKNPIKY